MTDTPDPARMGINNVNINKRRKKHDRHNYAKFKILRLAIQMQKDGLTINSVRLAKLLEKSPQQICRALYHLSYEYPYLKEYIDPEKTDSCTKMYTVTKQGRSVYKRLVERFNKGLDLNLKRKHPRHVEYEIVNKEQKTENP